MFMTCVIFINFHESIEKNYTNHCHSSFGGVASWILAQTHSRTFADKMSWISSMRSVKPCFKDRQKPEKKTCFQFPSLIKSTLFAAILDFLIWLWLLTTLWCVQRYSAAWPLVRQQRWQGRAQHYQHGWRNAAATPLDDLPWKNLPQWDGEGALSDVLSDIF